MDRSDRIEDARERLRQQIELLRDAFPHIHEIAEDQGKDGLAKYLTERFGAAPEQDGHDLVFKQWRFPFNEVGGFLGLSSGDNLSPTALRKSVTGKDGRNDT